MKPKYKGKMLQKQRQRAQANRAESKQSNKPKTTSAKRMRKLRERRKAETSGVAMELKNDLTEQTTLSGRCIDLSFSRYMHLICEPYVSYFSYHYPVFNKITL
jgi:hypothetical protein